MIEAFILIIGLVFGSFLNVCIFRIPRGESVSYPPSHCMKCGTKIKAYDLFPVISYILLRGKCRKCGDKISIRYPLVELFTGLIFLSIYFKYGLNVDSVKYFIFSCFLIVIGLIDFDTTDVYLKTTLPSIIIGIVFIGINYFLGNEFTTFIFGGVLTGGIIALIILITGGMGWGDFEICLFSGLFLGFKPSIIMLFFSFVIGGAFGVFLIITKRKSRKDYIPFGPYIAIGAFISMFWGNEIIKWYMSFLQ